MTGLAAPIAPEYEHELVVENHSSRGQEGLIQPMARWITGRMLRRLTRRVRRAGMLSSGHSVRSSVRGWGFRGRKPITMLRDSRWQT